MNLILVFLISISLLINVSALNCGGVDWSAFISRFPNYRCCGTNVYDPQNSICCNGRITAGNSNYACCGSYGYDTTFLCCINGLVKSGCKDTLPVTTSSLSSGMRINSNKLLTLFFILINFVFLKYFRL